MAHPLNWAIEMAMRQADRNGEFQNLPGAGKPLENLHGPKDAVINRILKENGAKPAPVLLMQEIAREQATLKSLEDAAERKAQMKKISDLQMKLAIEIEAYTKYS